MSLEIFLVHALAPLGSNPGSVPDCLTWQIVIYEWWKKMMYLCDSDRSITLYHDCLTWQIVICEWWKKMVYLYDSDKSVI